MTKEFYCPIGQLTYSVKAEVEQGTKWDGEKTVFDGYEIDIIEMHLQDINIVDFEGYSFQNTPLDELATEEINRQLKGII